ncbi:MAG: ActR/PrrA/RegA family redox response regulator transcription factor [Paracoccus sp. (in: a-proteobacteria)]|nr:ActR/PrrA/RegA family redox response regulator transcription factor [Paracoccus sp. (in: a-proteobacteria)]
MGDMDKTGVGKGRSLLLVDDDPIFVNRLARAMDKRGFVTRVALSVAEARAAMAQELPSYAVVDLRLEDGSGLDVVEALREARDDLRVIVLTGYGAIATAVAAVKMGAIDYLAKPADADEIAAALLQRDDSALPPPSENPMSADRVRWEHIQRVYEQCDRNVSETARRLHMHRRTLQRILAKRSPQ